MSTPSESGPSETHAHQQASQGYIFEPYQPHHQPLLERPHQLQLQLPMQMQHQYQYLPTHQQHQQSTHNSLGLQLPSTIPPYGPSSRPAPSAQNMFPNLNPSFLPPPPTTGHGLSTGHATPNGMYEYPFAHAQPGASQSYTDMAVQASQFLAQHNLLLPPHQHPPSQAHAYQAVHQQQQQHQQQHLFHPPPHPPPAYIPEPLPSPLYGLSDLDRLSAPSLSRAPSLSTSSHTHSQGQHSRAASTSTSISNRTASGSSAGSSFRARPVPAPSKSKSRPKARTTKATVHPPPMPLPPPPAVLKGSARQQALQLKRQAEAMAAYKARQEAEDRAEEAAKIKRENGAGPADADEVASATGWGPAVDSRSRVGSATSSSGAGASRDIGLGAPPRFGANAAEPCRSDSGSQSRAASRARAREASESPPFSPPPSLRSTDPPSFIGAINIKHPLLPAPPGTMYSVNNFLIMIPEHYSPPGTDIPASEFEQYTCRLCRKTYTGKNARSVARRHLQDKHEVRLELQERRSRWDRSDLPLERPRDEVERLGRNRANKAVWAKKHRLAERERIQEAILRDQLPIPKRYKGKGWAVRPRVLEQAAEITHESNASASGMYSQGTYPCLPSPTESTTTTMVDSPAPVTLYDAAALAEADEIAGGSSTGAQGKLVAPDFKGSVTLSTPPRIDATLQGGSEARTEMGTAQTESSLPSSPDLAKLAAEQDWVRGSEDWDQASWERDLAMSQGMAAAHALDHSAIASATAATAPGAEGPQQEGPIAELAAESLLNLHSTPIRPTPAKRTFATSLAQSRPTPLRRATLGSSSSTAIPSDPFLPMSMSTFASSSMSLGMGPSMLMGMSMSDHFPGWPAQMLDTPISLRPRAKRTQSYCLAGQGAGPFVKGRLSAVERSLSFSAALEDPFDLSPGPGFVLDNKENEHEAAAGDGSGGGGGARGAAKVEPGQRLSIEAFGRGREQDRNGSPVPTGQRRRNPLSAINYNSHSALSTTLSALLAPSPEKKPTPAIANFATPTMARRSGTFTGGGGSGLRGDAGFRRWDLSSPAGNGIAAELGLVGPYSYIAGLEETPGAVRSETPARGRG